MYKKICVLEIEVLWSKIHEQIPKRLPHIKIPKKGILIFILIKPRLTNRRACFERIICRPLVKMQVPAPYLVSRSPMLTKLP